MGYASKAKRDGRSVKRPTHSTSKNNGNEDRERERFSGCPSQISGHPPKTDTLPRNRCLLSAKSRLPQQVVLMTKRASCAATFTITKQPGPDVANEARSEWRSEAGSREHFTPAAALILNPPPHR